MSITGELQEHHRRTTGAPQEQRALIVPLMIPGPTISLKQVGQNSFLELLLFLQPVRLSPNFLHLHYERMNPNVWKR